MKKIFLILFIASSLLAQGQKNYLTTRSFDRASLGSTLYKNLIAFWKFDGNWNDSIGHNNLYPSGGAYVSATGKSGQAASFEKDSSQYASCAGSSLQFVDGESFTFSAWINMESSAGNNHIFENNLVIQYNGYITSSNNAVFRILNSTVSVSSSPSTLNDATWDMCTFWFNEDTDSIYVRINNGTIYRASTSGPTTKSASDFVVGKYSTVYADMLVDDLGIWKRCPQGPTYAMADSIYNAGAGWRP